MDPDDVSPSCSGGSPVRGNLYAPCATQTFASDGVCDDANNVAGCAWDGVGE